MSFDVLTVRSLVASALASDLGTYTFSNAATTPALRVETGSQDYPERPTVSGLEVIIKPRTDTAYTPMLAGDFALDDRGEVILKQWDTSRNTIAATNKLLKTLQPYIESVEPRIQRDELLDTVEQQILIIS